MMKTKQIIVTFLVLTLFSPAALTLASTYLYVDSGGNTRTVVADSSAAALAIAPNIHINSGVMRINGTTNLTTIIPYIQPINYSNSFYQYVDIYGNIQAVNASSPAQALAIAPNISPRSGVIRVNTLTML